MRYSPLTKLFCFGLSVMEKFFSRDGLTDGLTDGRTDYDFLRCRIYVNIYRTTIFPLGPGTWDHLTGKMFGAR
jgi:hypothetical protein